MPTHPLFRLPWRVSAATARLAACAVPALLVACATPPPAHTLRFTRPVVLLGEVHDNAAQHGLRLQAFQAWLDTGARPALVMEQLDTDRQTAIDHARAAAPLDADALIAAAGGGQPPPGWQWQHYRPFIVLALQHGLPIVAANLSRGAAREVMRGGLAAGGYDSRLPPALLAAQAAAIVAGHCGMVDADTAQRMALAQVARDQTMARVVEAQAAASPDGVLLLAGNGHVRTDIGVPHWLASATRSRTQAVGMLERGDRTAAFDSRVLTPAQPRPDPCAGLQHQTAPAKAPA